MIENPYTVILIPPDSAGGLGRQLLATRVSSNNEVAMNSALLRDALSLTRIRNPLSKRLDREVSNARVSSVYTIPLAVLGRFKCRGLHYVVDLIDGVARIIIFDVKESQLGARLRRGDCARKIA